MTFTEIVNTVAGRVNVRSAEGLTRIGENVNTRYKRITSSCGIASTSRRATVQASVTLGVQTVLFTGVEKILTVSDRSSGADRFLDEVLVEEITGALSKHSVLVTGSPRRYAIYRVNANSVQILMDYIPQAALTLYADGYERASTLSGSAEPAFDESFHDILVFQALADEYRKMEKVQLARDAETDGTTRLNELKQFLATSAMLSLYQGKVDKTSGMSGGGSGSSTGVNGATSYTQTGLITFDRDPLAPFAVTSGSAKVTNLDADLLDGQTGVDYHNAALLTGAISTARLTSGTIGALVTSTATGSQHNWSVGLVGDTFIQWTGASALTVTGFAPGVVGQKIFFRNNGTQVALFSHSSGSSTAGNRLFNTVSSSATPVAPQGHITYIYDGTFWNLVDYAQGSWITYPYSAGNFTATTSTWGVDDADETIIYHLEDDVLNVKFTIVNTDVGGTPQNLILTIPGGFSATGAVGFEFIRARNAGGTIVSGMCQPAASSTTLLFWPSLAGTSWSATTSDDTSVEGHAHIVVT